MRSAQLAPADVAILAALGDVLGTPAETMAVLREHVAPGGFVVISDVFLRDGGSADFAGFDQYQTRAATVAGLTAWGDTLVSEVVNGEIEDVADAQGEAIERRALALAWRHPEQSERLLEFARNQRAANEHIAENLSDVVWVLRRSGDALVR